MYQREVSGRAWDPYRSLDSSTVLGFSKQVNIQSALSPSTLPEIEIWFRLVLGLVCGVHWKYVYETLERLHPATCEIAVWVIQSFLLVECPSCPTVFQSIAASMLRIEHFNLCRVVEVSAVNLFDTLQNCSEDLFVYKALTRIFGFTVYSKMRSVCLLTE